MAVTIINRNVNIEHNGQKGPEGFGTSHIITSYAHLKGGNLQTLPQALQSKCLEKNGKFLGGHLITNIDNYYDAFPL